MTALLAGLSASLLVAGVLVMILGAHSTDTEQSTGQSTGLWTTVDKWWRKQSRLRRAHLVGAVGGGVVAFLVTGWTPALIAVPLVVLGLPALLGEPANKDIALLEALDRWVRSLAASIPTGKSVTDAMRATAGQAPRLLATPVQLAVARLDARWTTQETLLRLADDLDSPDADAVIAALVLASQRGGIGATAILTELAESNQARLRALREIEAERAKPRVVVRQVTMISVVAIGGALLARPGYFAAYRTPVGEVVVLCLATVYVGSLLALRRMTMPRRRERILRQPVEEGSHG